jgi:RNA polymerase sigma factor (sigma-70 family)
VSVAHDSVPPGASDEALVAGMAASDRDATVAFVRRYQRRVFGLALTVVGDAPTAEDVAQESLLRAWRHSSVYDARRGTVERWVLTIARRQAIDALRRRRDLPVDPATVVERAAVETDATLEERVEAGERRAVVVAALRDLPVDQRRAIVLAALHGRTAREVGEIEGVPLGTAKTRIRSALIRLRDAVVEREAGAT